MYYVFLISQFVEFNKNMTPIYFLYAIAIMIVCDFGHTIFIYMYIQAIHYAIYVTSEKPLQIRFCVPISRSTPRESSKVPHPRLSLPHL